MNPGGFNRIKCDVPRPNVARIVIASGPDNPLDLEVCGELFGALGFVHGTASIRAVVIGHEGPYFCSGGEVPSVPTPDGNMVGPLAELLKGIHTLGKPIIAAIDGKVAGSGLAIALATDLAVAGPAAALLVPEANPARWWFQVLAELVPLVGSRVAADLLRGGGSIDAARAHGLGLVNHVVSGLAGDEALDRAAELAALDPPAAVLGLPLRRAAGAEVGVHEWPQGQLDALMDSADGREALVAAREGRAPSWQPS